MTETKFRAMIIRYPAGKQDQLIPVLQEIQDMHGYIPEEVYPLIADHLRIPAVKVCSVASFYNEFRITPAGKYHIQICEGIGCLLERSEELRKTIKMLLDISPGEITRDGWFSLESLPCLGVCQESPVIKINGKVRSKMDPVQLREMIRQLKEESGHESK